MSSKVAGRHARLGKSGSTTLGRRLDIAAAAGGSLDAVGSASWVPSGHVNSKIGVFIGIVVVS